MGDVELGVIASVELTAFGVERNLDGIADGDRGSLLAFVFAEAREGRLAWVFLAVLDYESATDPVSASIVALYSGETFYESSLNCD